MNSRVHMGCGDASLGGNSSAGNDPWSSVDVGRARG